MKPGKMPGGGGMNMNAIMKQAQKMQQDMVKMQEELAQKEYEASAGGGAVKATVQNGELKALALDPEVVSPDDIDMLTDLVIAATNEALRQCEEEKTQKMQGLTGGMPGLF